MALQTGLQAQVGPPNWPASFQKAQPSGSKRRCLHTLAFDGATCFEERATYKKPRKTIGFYRFFAYPPLRTRSCNPPKNHRKHAAPSLKLKSVAFLLYECSWTAVSQLCKPFSQPFGSNLEALRPNLVLTRALWGRLWPLLDRTWELLGATWDLLGAT